MGTIKKYNISCYTTEFPLEVDTTCSDIVEFNITDPSEVMVKKSNTVTLTFDDVKELIDQLSAWVGLQIA